MSPLRVSRNQAAWYASSWRSLQLGAPTPGDSRLNTPETTPTSIPTNLATAPFCGDFPPLFSRVFVSVGTHPLWQRFLALSLRIQKFRSQRPVLGPKSECS